MTDAVIIAARRTAVGRTAGLFRARSAPQLAAPVINALLADCQLDGADIDEVILGNVLQGGNVARSCALETGLPPAVPALSVDRQCGSGLEAILQAAWKIRAGAARVILAGGVESTSCAPWRVERPSSPTDLPRFVAQAPFSGGGHRDPSMIEGADAVAETCGIGRAAQDAYAAGSHARALAAQAAGRFAGELVSVYGPPEADEGPRPGLTAARLGRLKPLRAGGTVTVGNSCATNDCAALLMVVEAGFARRLGVTHALRIVDGAAGGGDPAFPGLGAVPAARHLARRAGGLVFATLDQIEFNEAFAAQTLACLAQLSIPEALVCPGGGALALGHPYGASGAILMTRLFHDLTGALPTGEQRRGMALLSIAGGLGLAATVETVTFPR